MLGDQVTLITANYQNMPQKERAYGVDIIRVASLRKHREHCSFMEMMSYLWKTLSVASSLQKKEKFDFCFVFLGIPSGPIGYVLRKKYKLPYVIRFGGGDVPGFQGRGIYTNFSGLCKVKGAMPCRRKRVCTD